MAENTRQTGALGITPFRKRLEVIVSEKPAKPPPKPKRSAKARKTKPKNPSRLLRGCLKNREKRYSTTDERE
jgi:hypothetical protein